MYICFICSYYVISLRVYKADLSVFSTFFVLSLLFLLDYHDYEMSFFFYKYVDITIRSQVMF